MSKYLENVKESEPIGTSDGFYYDLFEGGYVVPKKVLADEERVKEIEGAIRVIEDFYRELVEDGIYNDEI